MRQPPDTAERRPGPRDAVPEAHADSGTSLRVTQAAEPPTALARAIAELLELSGERDKWAQRLGDEYRLGFAIGHALGVDEGRRLEVADRDRAWNRAAGTVIRGETYAELERRRWGPGGRKHFGDPRPADRCPGRQEGAA